MLVISWSFYLQKTRSFIKSQFTIFHKGEGGTPKMLKKDPRINVISSSLNMSLVPIYQNKSNYICRLLIIHWHSAMPFLQYQIHQIPVHKQYAMQLIRMNLCNISKFLFSLISPKHLTCQVWRLYQSQKFQIWESWHHQLFSHWAQVLLL